MGHSWNRSSRPSVNLFIICLRLNLFKFAKYEEPLWHTKVPYNNNANSVRILRLTRSLEFREPSPVASCERSLVARRFLGIGEWTTMGECDPLGDYLFCPVKHREEMLRWSYWPLWFLESCNVWADICSVVVLSELGRLAWSVNKMKKLIIVLCDYSPTIGVFLIFTSW